MEFTCLSEGKGYYFPPCHILDVCGFRVLFDCPMDLSSLAVFSPVPIDSIANGGNWCYSSRKDVGCESNEEKRRKVDRPIDAGSLICAEPRYRTVKNLFLWNVSFINVVLISSPMGMLGLPYLTRNKDFSAKVYITEAAARIGQLMMEDLVNMHKEFRQFYGSEESDGPQWMKWDEIEMLPQELRQIFLGADGLKFGAWMPLYSAADVKACLLKVVSLKYAEEACYNGVLIIKAFSSGLEIGSCNWSITTPKGSIAYISSSVFSAATSMSFNFRALERSNVILYSDFSGCNAPENFDNDNNLSGQAGNSFSHLSDDDALSEARTMLLSDDEYLEEIEKLNFICSCAMDSIKAGGSVLIPIGRLGIILQLLERFAHDMASEDMKVPIFVVSSVAKELMSYTNIIPEWLCEHWQDRLYSGQPIFAHAEMLKDKRLDQNSLLVVEEGVDANLALLPYKPMAMKVLQCSFISGIEVQKCRRLLKLLQPKNILFPETSKLHVTPLETSLSLTYYSENTTLSIPYPKEDAELDIEVELAHQLQYTTLEQRGITVARLKGELVVEHGRYRLIPGNKDLVSSQSKPPFYFGRVDANALVTALQKMGVVMSVEEATGADIPQKTCVIHVLEPSKARIEIKEAETLVRTGDERAVSLISQAIHSILRYF